MQSSAGGATAAHAPGVAERKHTVGARCLEGGPGEDIVTLATKHGAAKIEKSGFQTRCGVIWRVLAMTFHGVLGAYVYISSNSTRSEGSAGQSAVVDRSRKQSYFTRVLYDCLDLEILEGAPRPHSPTRALASPERRTHEV